MKLTPLIIALITLFIGRAPLYSQAESALLLRTININEINSIDNIIKSIENHKIIVSYNPESLDKNYVIDIPKGIYRVIDLLKIITTHQPVRYVLKRDKIIFIPLPKFYTLSGYIRETGSGESIIGASIIIDGRANISTSNEYGFFSISVREGRRDIQIQSMGYKTLIINKLINSDCRELIHLEANNVSLDTIRIISTKAGDINALQEQKDLSLVDFKPSFMGVNDVLKRLQYYSGVLSLGPWHNSLQVRGGDSDQNLVLLDGIPVYNYNHCGSLLSIFNADALKSVTMHKGFFPTKFEGRLASVVDIRMKDGDKENFHITSTIDMLTASIMAEGPLKKGRSSFMVSARRSWPDLFTKIISNNERIKISMYDINAKSDIYINPNNRLYISSYIGADNFMDIDSYNNTSVSWSNKLFSVKWNHIFSNSFFNSSSISYSSFYNKIKPESYIERDGTIANISHFKSPYIAPYYDDSQNSKVVGDRSFHVSAYIENGIKIGSRVNFTLGMNHIIYFTRSKKFSSFQPRAGITYSIGTKSMLYAGYSKMMQFYHQLTITGLATPYEVRVPSSKDLDPESSDTYELGFKTSFGNSGQAKLVLYNREMNKILAFRPQQDILNFQVAPDWRDRIISGRRLSRGVELFYKQSIGRFDNTISYTISKSFDSFNDINQGKRFPSNFDKRHVLNMLSTYHPCSKSAITLSFNLQSGPLMTLPEYLLPDGNSYYFDSYNNYRLPLNYRFDAGYVFNKSIGNGGVIQFKCGIYNFIGNHYSYYRSVIIKDGKVVIESTSPRKFLPYLSVTFKI